MVQATEKNAVKKKQAEEEVDLVELGIETKVLVTFTGISPVMFDRFISKDETEYPPERKLYLREEKGGKKRVILPSANIMSFLAGEKKSCTAFFAPKMKAPVYRQMLWGSVNISPDEIPFTQKGKPVYFDGFKEGSKFRIDQRKGIVTKNGKQIPLPLTRPVMDLPWELEFQTTLFSNDLKFAFFGEGLSLSAWFVRGGFMVAIGNFRPYFGKFTVKFEELE